jgi:hypothetical protein
MDEFLRSVPAAAVSVYALVAYAVAVLLFVIGYTRHRAGISLVGGLLIAVLAVGAIAVLKPVQVKPVAAVEDTAMQGNVETWRRTHPFGEISGAASVALNLPPNERPQELDAWLGRVTKRYQELKRKGERLPREELEGGKPGNEYVEIKAYSSPPRNQDLEAQGEAERFVEYLLFRPYYFVIASRDDAKDAKPQGPVISVQAQGETVKVFFDGQTQRPYRIEGTAVGKGNFTPIAGQFTSWLDFYGANLTVRVRAVGTSPQTLSLARIESFSFTTRNEQWRATARLGSTGEVKPAVNFPGSLTVAGADWRTLGPLPADFPGKRLPSHGPRPVETKPEAPVVRP